jgi:RNA polymerase sigma-70 factor (ECF subfamily)
MGPGEQWTIFGFQLMAPREEAVQPEGILSERLSQIPTLWSLVYRAHQGPREAIHSARQQLLERYRGTVERYLRKVLGDPDAAAEVFQEFALELLHGKLRGASPERGRFRNYVKGTLFHLIADYRTEERMRPMSLPDDSAKLPADPDDEAANRHFLKSWCDELLARTWVELARASDRTSQPLFAVLRFRADHPEMRAPQLAEQLGVQLGKSFTAAGIRQILHRARKQFAALLLDEVTQSLENPTQHDLEDELAELGLLEYCRPALPRCEPNM